MELDSEQRFENDFVSWLGDVGWNSHKSDDKYGGKKLDEISGRKNSEVIHESLLKSKLIELNKTVTDDNVDEVYKSVKSELYTQSGLIESNKKFYNILYRGIDLQLKYSGKSRVRTVKLVDLDDIGNNRYDAVSQHTYVNDSGQIRPDVALFINGIPIVIGELKDSTRGKTTDQAIADIKDYEDEHERLFYPCLMNIASTRLSFLYGAVGASETHYNPWKPEDIDPSAQYGRTGYKVEDSVRSLLKPDTVVEFIKDFVFYDMKSSGIKVIPRHQQYFATEKIFNRVDNIKKQCITGARGLIWHTQGSGKSFTMYFASRIASRNKGSRVLILVDRKDLREQMGEELTRIESGFDTTVVTSQDELIEAVEGSHDIILTTIQLFDGIKNPIDESRETYIFSDEAHRNMEKDYGSHLEAAFPPKSKPHVHHFGFTGTPVSSKNRDTFNHYTVDGYEEDEPYLHRYSMRRGVEEGTIVEVDVKERKEISRWNIDEDKIDNSFLEQFGNKNQDEVLKRVDEELTIRDVAEISSRTDAIAEDINNYYEEHVANRRYSDKAMVVTASRKSAARIYERLAELRGEKEVAVLYSSGEDDEEILEDNYVNSDEREDIRTSFKEEENPKILVVCSMLLTGFDAPVLGTIFMDRMLQEHRLMQAIARANRPNEGKQFGEIVDYWGVTEDIEDMYEDINDEVTLYVSRNKEKFLEEFDSQLEELESQCTEDMPARNAAKIYENRNHDKFYEDFKRLRDIKSAVEPDKRIFEQNREERYEAMKQVYKTIRSVEEQDKVENTVDKEEFKKKAKKAIEDGADVMLDPENADTESSITVDKWMPEEIRLRQKQRELQSVLKNRSAQSPAFKDLSKRLEEIIEDWYQGQATEENMEEVDEIIEELDERTTPDEVDEREWLEQVAVDVLVEEVPMDVDVDDEMIDTIVDDFVQLWEDTRNITDEQERKSKIDTGIKKNMIRRSREYRKLVADTEFSSKATEYLARNMS